MKLNSYGHYTEDGLYRITAVERTPTLGKTSSIKELMETGAFPGDLRIAGESGVVLTDRTVRFGDIYKLGTLGDRRVEFALTSEIRDGKRVKVLYSGTFKDVVTPKSARLIGHVHPNTHKNQRWPSPGDMKVLSAKYFRQLEVNPNIKPQPSRIFWGEGDFDNTIFFPGYGKEYSKELLEAMKPKLRH
ncbi:hypothetical protein [Aliikangiella maris]|uniref:Uncharacterized protein n=2 Tax=Aliikangiella maris TaxID=3162458 RepID=A0ABV2BZ61_9GAMM